MHELTDPLPHSVRHVGSLIDALAVQPPPPASSCPLTRAATAWHSPSQRRASKVVLATLTGRPRSPKPAGEAARVGRPVSVIYRPHAP